MNRISSLTACLCMAVTFTMPLQAQNVQSKSPTVLNLLPAADPDVLRVQNGLLSHRVAGTIGQFGTADQWIGIGAPLSSLYGERTQWNGQAFIKALRSQNPAVPTAIKDAILEWGNQGGEMQFRYITNPTSPTGFLRIQTLTSAGNAYFGNNPPPLVTSTPRVGSTAISGAPAVSCYSTNANVGEFAAATKPGRTSTGVLGLISGTGESSFNYGVRGVVSTVASGSFNVGVYGEVSQQLNDIFSENYAIFGNATNTGSTFAGYFQGDVFATGLYLGSDRKLKKNITSENKVMDQLRKLNPVTYDFSADDYKGFNLPRSKQHGLIAQEVQAVFPELVRTNKYLTPDADGKMKASEEFLAVNYQALIPLLLKAIQEQQAEIDELKADRSPANPANVNPVTTDANPIIATRVGNFKASQFTLQQNTPNPFSSTTIIRYALPNGVGNASIAVFDLTGKMMLQYNNLNGSSQVTINASTLQAGMYVYALLVEGQEVVSKRMILTR
jgi:Chaperone of endosialidase/Secretion system C-terminal sorting domain